MSTPYTVTVSPRGVEVSFEVGSLGEAVEILSNNESTMASLVAIAVGGAGVVATGEGESTGNKRSRKPKNQPDPATAQAPAPAPVPSAPPVAPAAPAAPPPAPPIPAPAVQGQDGLTVPAFLDRSNPAAVANQAPPPPPLPSAPPVAPPAPTPAFILGGKVADDLEKRKAGSADSGAALHTWLMAASAGAILPGASLDEAIQVMRFTDDDKVRPIAQALGIS